MNITFSPVTFDLAVFIATASFISENLLWNSKFLLLKVSFFAPIIIETLLKLPIYNFLFIFYYANCIILQDIFDLFSGDETPYTYDSIVIAISQRRPPPDLLRGAVEQVITHLRDLSLQMLLGPEKWAGSSGSRVTVTDKEMASEGGSGVSNRKVDAHYYCVSLVFLLGILVLQCVLRRFRDRRAKMMK